ncbi:glycerol:H+ symporter-like protein [Aulographum hederae CBS 113979]|uniref:Glycerol:H+ symporter-like protein n=1 Tax=Aulographum hederae CBS 113979 TaxID=1176131 RepID=A0A6G1GTN0_9PEZI|nr:glycerol:H+ symporter-like protein [Aulographum hederae CBS 113979]
MVLQYLKKLYTLETLDTRFVVPATSPPKEALEQTRIDPANPLPANHGNITSNGAPASKSGPGPEPPKWKTTEFYVYFAVIFTSVVFMFKIAYGVSKESHPSYSKFGPLLSDGWIPGRKVDNSDAQYASFRNNIPYMAIVVILHPLLRKLYDSFWRSSTYTQVRSNSQLSHGLTANAAADARMEQRISFDLYFALAFLFVLHGVSAFKVLLIFRLNYLIATAIPKQYVPAATWTFNIATLFANELGRGYPLAGAVRFLIPSPAEGDATLVGWAKALDGYGGLIPRWEVLFNITVLRLISFNLDHYWSLSQRGGSPLEKKQLDPSNLSERDRVSISAKLSDYSFRNYIAYALYSPLYLAGPILTFNDYISQLRYRAPSITTQRTLMYGIRFLLTLLTMEVVLHFIYAVAISKAQPTWQVYSPAQLSMLGYWNLHIIWLKLLIPWRFFRLWALLDGIDPPENMVRCMSNNYSALAFWRGWHRSFNRWIVRYIYIPLGGSTSGPWGKVRSIANFLAVFTFVALWHDINLRLLMWGWLVTLFVLPEIIATMLFPKRKWEHRPNTYRWICGIGATGNILMMMAANLVGFAVGLDGLKGLVEGIVGSFGGLVFLVVACGALFTGAQVMFEIREDELRHGIRMKC